MLAVSRRGRRSRRCRVLPRHARGLLARALIVGVFSSGCAARVADAQEPAVTALGPPPGAGLAAAARERVLIGRDKSETERCQECHGPTGNAEVQETGAAGTSPKLAGQYAQYIVKEFRDFRSGARKNDAMAVMANSLDDADVADIAAYFASQPRMKGAGGADADLARRLYLSGDPARGMTACVECHGESGQGSLARDVPVPVIGGQQWRYLDKQLRDWRSGERHNSRDAIMNRNARGLTDPEIEALAYYISHL